MSARLAISGGFLLILAGFALVGLQAASDRPPAEAAPTPPPGPDLETVVVAGRSLERGDVVTREALAVRRIEPPLPAGAARRPEALAGRVATRAIAASQIVFAGDLVEAGSPRGGLAPLVPEGMRGVALTVTDRTAVGNFVRPDDVVDVNVLLPSALLNEATAAPAPTRGRGDERAIVLLQGVRVLAAGDSLTVEEAGRATRIQTVTLALDPDQALRLGLAARLGSDVFLTLRHPRDRERVKVAPLDGRTLDPRTAPRPAQPVRPAPTAAATDREVLVVRGGVATPVRVPVAAPAATSDDRQP